MYLSWQEYIPFLYGFWAAAINLQQYQHWFSTFPDWGPKRKWGGVFLHVYDSLFYCMFGEKTHNNKSIFIMTAFHYKSLDFSRKIISYPDSVPVAGGQFKLGRQFPIFHTNSKRSNFSSQSLYYSPFFTGFLQCQRGIHLLQLSPSFLSRSLACYRAEGNVSLMLRAWHCWVAELLKAMQPWGVKEMHVKLSAAVTFPLLQTWGCRWAICEMWCHEEQYL